MLSLAIIILLIALIALRVPISFAIFSAAIVGLSIWGGLDLAVHTLETSPFAAIRSNSLSAVPLFILMAQLILISGLLDSLFDASRAFVGRLPGGTAIASVGAGTAFAAVSGSSTAAAATLAQTSSTRMIKEGYSKETSTGLVAVVGTLAAMIPPSIILVFYAITAEANVGDVLIAGFFPGLLVSVSLMATMYLGFARNRSAAPLGRTYTWRTKAALLVRSSPLFLVFIAVVGSIFFGIATPTEAATLGVVAASVLVIANGRWKKDLVQRALLDTVKTTAMIFAIIMSAHVLGHFLTKTKITPKIVTSVESSQLSPFLVMCLIGLLYVGLGFFMDQIAIIALTVPVTLPIIEALGYDPIWFGIFIVLLAETGMVTPPMGLNVFVVAKSVQISPMIVFRGAFPYVVAMLLIALLILIWPEIVLWVPNLSK